MNELKKESIKNYCKLIDKNIKDISEDEIKTAYIYEKLINKYNLKKVKKVNLPINSSSNYFYSYYYKNNQPIIIRNLNHKIGKCIKNFNNKNIIKNIGKTKVSIHVSNSKFLNNVNKNFHYVLSSLENFIFLISKEDKKKKKFSISYNKGKIHISLKNKNSYEIKNKKEDEVTNISENECYNIKNKNSIKIFSSEKKISLNSDENEMNDDKSINKEIKDNEENVLINNKEIKKNKNENKIEHNNYYYYRSLGVNQFKEVSDIKKMNSFIKDNIYMPKDIYPSYEKFEFFSSILRIGQTNIFIWLHYDIPDNFLIQIRGRKKILLIHPKFIKYFNIVGSSSFYNLFLILIKKKLNRKERIIKKILIKYALVADILEGDILFIPSLWLHYIYNMPPHTYVKKKYKNFHQYMVINEKNLSSNSSTNCKKNKIKHNSRKFYFNSKFKNIIKNKSLKPLLYLKDGSIILNNFYFKNKKHRKKKMFFLKNEKNPLKIFLNNKEEICNDYKICTDQNSIDKNDLIKHYSHLENYEEYLSKKYHIHIDKNKEEDDNKVSFNKVEKKRNFEMKKNKEKAIYIMNTKKDNHEYAKHSCDVAEKEKNYKTVKKKSKACKNFFSNTKLNISFNYFFRKKKETYLFSKKDLYGNQDVNAASQIFKKIQKEIMPIISMSSKYKNFYLQKIQGLLFSYLDDDYI